MKQKPNRLFSRAAMVLLMMLLTATTAGATEVTAVYALTYSTLTQRTTLTHNGGNYESVTWDYMSGTNSTPWNGGVTHGVDDEYGITFKPDKYLTLVGSYIRTSAETKFTVTVSGTNAYFIKSASIGGVTANADLHAKSLDVTVPSGSTINVLYVTLIRYYTVTPASGLHVTSGTSATSGGTTYYKPGTIVTVAPTNTHHIVEGTGGTGSASVSVASDKRSFSFTMSDQDVSPTATLTEVYRVSPASGITLSPAAYFTYGDAQYYKPNTTITLSSTVPTGQHVIYKAGNKTLAGNTYTVNSSDGDVTLTAEYPYNTYTVQFNGNGSTSGSMSNQSFTYATAQNLTDNAFTRTGYTFAGWNTKADGSGTSYINQQSVNNLTTTNGGTVTLYAQWTANTYTVTLNKQDGNGGSASATATYDAAMPAITVPTRTGYTFGGYFTQTNGGGTQYYNADGSSTRTWNLIAATTLYAKWAIITYNITYELDGGSADNPTSYNIETPDFTLTNPTKEGYHFVGWTEGNNNTLLPTVTIEQGSTGNLDYTAHYKTNNFTVGDLSYQWTSGTEVKVTACNPSATSVTIPATVSNSDGTYTVTAIDATAFSGCTSLLCLILNSETPPTLGSNAFSACTALNAIGVPEGTAAAYKATAGWLDYEDKIYAINGKCGTNVYYSYNSTTTTLSIFGTGAMANYTYWNMPWYSYRTEITTVVIGDGVTSICQNAFYDCTSLKSVEIPASVTSIGDFAFMYCTSLESVEIPASVTYIGGEVFYGCTSLKSIEIPASVTSIGDAAFAHCTSLASISVAEGNPTYDSRKECNAIIETATNTLIQGCKKTVIPGGSDGVTSIGFAAFAYCTSLESITIPASVTSIGDNVFEGCTSLESIVISASVTSIGDRAFQECTSLESIEIPASVTSIGDEAFYGCSGLESISVESGNTVYDSRNSCNALIETNTNTLLYGCKNTVIPDGSDGVTSIGWEAFADCTRLESVEIPASVTSIGDDAFANCTGLTSVEIPASVTSIGDGVFYGCTSLESVEIPASVTSIGDEAFANCTGLTSVEIPASMTSIGHNAFEGCTSLESIEIPASVTSIGDAAFVDCTDLSTVTIYAPELSEYGFYAFDGNAEDRKIYVFKNCVETYKAKAEDMGANEDDIEAITDINLKDNDDNRSLIAAANDNALGALNVTLKGRTLYKDGKWNTLCLPFNVVLEGSPLEGATARPLKAASITGTTLNLTFDDAVDAVDELVAGTPYIIKWAGGDDIVNPVFTDVTIDATDRSFTSGTGDKVSFLGTYKSTTYTDEDKSILFLGADNTLYYPEANATIGACRAYFKIVEDDAPQPVRKLMSFRLVFGNDETLSGSFAASIQRGDANADGNVSVTDIAVVVNCILQLDNTGGFSDYGADANGDGDITVTDIGVIVDKILGSPSPTPPEGGEPQ